MGEPNEFYQKWAEEETGKKETRQKVDKHLKERKAASKLQHEDQVKEDAKKEEQDRGSGLFLPQRYWFESHMFFLSSLSRTQMTLRLPWPCLCLAWMKKR